MTLCRWPMPPREIKAGSFTCLLYSQLEPKGKPQEQEKYPVLLCFIHCPLP